MSAECPCQSRKLYDDCCYRYHNGNVPQTAEQLMRSRYTAFVLELSDYLLTTWHPSTRPGTITFNELPKQKWLGLQIKRHEQINESHAIVEFVARYSVNGRAHRLHECSNFIKENNCWFYIDGVFP